jgi:hypothetical protein
MSVRVHLGKSATGDPACTTAGARRGFAVGVVCYPLGWRVRGAAGGVWGLHLGGCSGSLLSFLAPAAAVRRVDF